MENDSLEKVHNFKLILAKINTLTKERYLLIETNQYWHTTRFVTVAYNKKGQVDARRTLGDLYIAQYKEPPKGYEVIATITKNSLEVFGDNPNYGTIAVSFWQALKSNK